MSRCGAGGVLRQEFLHFVPEVRAAIICLTTMSKVEFSEQLLDGLKDKVIIITGKHLNINTCADTQVEPAGSDRLWSNISIQRAEKSCSET